MAELNMTNFAPILKEHYTSQRIADLVYKKNPLYAMMKKNEGWGGKYEVVPLKFGNTVGTSATFSVAQANKGPSKYGDFLIPTVDYYSLADISTKVQLASKGDARAFLEAVTSEIDSALAAHARNLAISMYGDQSGQIGVIANVATDVLTLSEVSAITNFEVGQKLVFAQNNTSNLRGAASAIIAIDRSAGTITLASGGGAASGVVNGDAAFFEGDYTNSQKTLKIAGLKSWIPDSAPSATAFFGLDRSVDVTRLGGLREDYSAAPIEEAVIDMASQLSSAGGSPDLLFVNYTKYSELVKALGSKVQYINESVGKIGFQGITIAGPDGMIKVIPDRNCPANRGYMLTMDSWELGSLGAASRILDLDGNKTLRNSTSDSVEVRVGGYANVACHAPGFSGLLKF